MTVRETLLRLIFPPKCVFCRTLLPLRGESCVCPVCRVSLPAADSPCGAKAEFVEEVAAAYRYKGAVRDSIRRFKFSGRRFYADAYAEAMADAVRRQLHDPYDLITWAPLSKKRKRRRGYDQSEALAAALSRRLGLPLLPLLRKARDIPAQSGLTDAAARRANVSGAYEAADPAAAEGRRILLVDDVITTGSTLSECARILRMAGAESVGAAVIATAQKR